MRIIQRGICPIDKQPISVPQQRESDGRWYDQPGGGCPNNHTQQQMDEVRVDEQNG